MNEYDRETFRLLLAAFIEGGDVTVRKVARAIGCSNATLTRVLAGKTLPSDDLMKQGGVMFELGFERYSKLSASERENISEKIGAVGGGVLGFGVITAAIGAFGLPGLSAAGVTSGLAALGGIVGGGMVAGVSVVAAIPLAVGTGGYALTKGVKRLISERRLNATDVDTRWELTAADRPESA